MKRTVLAGTALAALFATSPAFSQEKYLGEIILVGFTFCPRGTVEAAGQIMSIAQNTALFALYGTTYGGNGQTTFALPDLQGRVAMGVGTGGGLPPATQAKCSGLRRPR